MRRTFVLFGFVLAVASPALAQSNRGAIGLDIRVTPTTSLGLSYYLTDSLSVRPWLGLGYSEYSGLYASLGLQLRYELMAQRQLSPFLSATAQYSHYGDSGGQLGAGAGLRFRVSRSVSLFSEGRLMYATSGADSLGTGWSTVRIDDNTRVEVVLGLTYLFR